MAVSTKERIAEAARKRFKTQDVLIADDVHVTVRELSPAEMRSLKERLWERDADGKFVVLDDKGQPSADGNGFYKRIAGVSIVREWLLATMLPTDAVDEILSDEVPDSVKDEIFQAAKAINGEVPADVIAKNS